MTYIKTNTGGQRVKQSCNNILQLSLLERAIGKAPSPRILTTFQINRIQYSQAKILNMKVSFAIFFFVILGVTSAKHLTKEEYKGFGTVDELDELYLPASDETEFDDPEENRKKVSGLMVSI